MSTPKEIIEHYNLAQEATRLKNDFGWLERIRTEDLLRRHLPPAPALVLDIGGAAGIYALPLAEKGYEVHLLDPVPLHIEQAKRASEDQVRKGSKGLTGAQIGDARELPFQNESADAVVFLGPLYHLPDGSDRLRALREANRVLKKNGILIAAAISRFASLMDGLMRGLMKERIFRDLADQDLRTGQHRNETGDPRYFTTAFLHRPEELKDEVREAGFHVETLVGVEGPVWNPAGLEFWASREELLLDYLRKVESEPSLIGASAHLVAVGRK